jgi:expansin (peptidoglycan-binding protein)
MGGISTLNHNSGFAAGALLLIPVASEMELHVLAYNRTRVLNFMGAGR